MKFLDNQKGSAILFSLLALGVVGAAAIKILDISDLKRFELGFQQTNQDKMMLMNKVNIYLNNQLGCKATFDNMTFNNKTIPSKIDAGASGQVGIALYGADLKGDKSTEPLLSSVQSSPSSKFGSLDIINMQLVIPRKDPAWFTAPQSVVRAEIVISVRKRKRSDSISSSATSAGKPIRKPVTISLRNTGSTSEVTACITDLVLNESNGETLNARPQKFTLQSRVKRSMLIRTTQGQQLFKFCSLTGFSIDPAENTAAGIVSKGEVVAKAPIQCSVFPVGLSGEANFIKGIPTIWSLYIDPITNNSVAGIPVKYRHLGVCEAVCI